MSTALITRNSNSFNIPYTKISVVEDRNIRENYGDIKDLADSILAVGVKNPIKVLKIGEDKYELVSGHRRYAAAKLLYDKDKTNIVFPSVVVDKKFSDVDIITELMSDANSLPLTAMELSEAVSRLKAAKLTDDAISKLMGKSVVYVRELNKLSLIDTKTKNAIKQGVVAASTVREAIKKGTFDELVKKLGGTIEKPEVIQEALPKELAPAAAAAVVKAGDKATGKKTKKPTKKEVAKAAKAAAPVKKITKKVLQKINGIKELKRFAKNVKSFASDPKEKEFYTLVDIVLNNKWSYDDLTNYFVNGVRPKDDQ